MTTTFDEKKWAKDALLVQDACNLSGVAHSFSRMLREMSDANMGTDARNTHPLSLLFSSKIASMTGSESMLQFSKAYEYAKKMAGEE
jgi:hypothetical protein